MTGKTTPEEIRFITRRLEALSATPCFQATGPSSTILSARWRGLQKHRFVSQGGADSSWQLVTAHDRAPWFGSPTTLVFADRDRTDPRALAALTAALAADGDHLAPDVWLEIDPRDDGLLIALLGLGWHVDSVISAGSLALARERMDAVLGPTPPGGDAWRLLGPADVAPVAQLYATTFRANPEFCWFGAYPDHVAHVRDGLTAWTETMSTAEAHWVVDGPSGIAGHVSVDMADEPFWGRAAGVGIVLAPEADGKGLLKAAYRRAIVVARGEGANVWKGGTSQPAVMALGARLGRVWHQIGLRRSGKDLGLAHFARFQAAEELPRTAFSRPKPT